jgi:hypothetical protein
MMRTTGRRNSRSGSSVPSVLLAAGDELLDPHVHLPDLLKVKEPYFRDLLSSGSRGFRGYSSAR